MPANPIAVTPEDLVGEVRHVVLLACPDVSVLEAAGPAEVFSRVDGKLREAGRTRSRPYQVHLVAADDNAALRWGSGIQFRPECTFRDVDFPIDTLLVIGGYDVWTGGSAPQMLEWLRTVCPTVRRYGSVCTGAFVLAEAGLLDGQRATTHWYYCERLAREYPNVVVDSEPVYIRSGALSTAAGVTSGMDLALSMVEEDAGIDIAMRVARAMVMYVRRPGWQSQFSSALALQGSSRVSFRDLPFWLVENLGSQLSVAELAHQVAMSPRNFSRQFVSDFGMTPARFVANLRAETALRLLTESSKGREAIAQECGFGSLDAMERALKKVRARFTPPSPPQTPPP
jgi:transcriptional regulator GlxA family with amidase domain